MSGNFELAQMCQPCNYILLVVNFHRQAISTSPNLILHPIKSFKSNSVSLDGETVYKKCLFKLFGISTVT